jgi:hypothetical protein
MIDAYKIGVTIQLHDQVTPGLRAMAAGLTGLQERAALAQTKIQQLGDRLQGLHGLMVGGMAIGAGVAMERLFKAPIEAAAKYETQLARLGNIGGLDSAMIASVEKLARAQNMFGVGKTEALGYFADLHAAIGDSKEALAAMPAFAKLAFVYQAQGKGEGYAHRQLRDSAKTLEMLGYTKDHAGISTGLDFLARADVATNGAMNGSEFRQFVARAGTAARAMSVQGLANMAALVTEQGGAGAGVGLLALQNNLLNGRISNKAGFYLHQAGLVDEGKNKIALQQRWGDKWDRHKDEVTAGAIRGADVLRGDAVGWFATTALPLLAKAGISGDAQLTEFFAKGLSNARGSNEASLIATQLLRVQKDAHILTSSTGLDGQAARYQQTYAGRMVEYHKRTEDLMQTLGDTLLPTVNEGLGGLTDSLKTVDHWARENSRTVKVLAVALGGLGAALVVGGTLTVARVAFGAIGGAIRLVGGAAMELGGILGRGLLLGLRFAGQAVLFLGRALLFNPIGLVVTAIAGAAYLLYRNWATVGPYITKVWEIIRAVFHVSVAWISERVQSMWNVIKPYFDKVANILQGVGAWVGDAFQSVYSAVTGWLGKIIAWIANSPIGKAIGFVVDAAGKALTEGGKMANASLNAANQWAQNQNMQAKYGLHEGDAGRGRPHASQFVVPRREYPTHITVISQLDAREVARSTTAIQAKEAARPGVSGPRFDPTMGPRPVGLNYAK